MTPEKSNTALNSEELELQELREAQARLDAAKQKKADADNLKLSAARAAIAAREAEALRYRNEQAEIKKRALEVAMKAMADKAEEQRLAKLADEHARIVLEQNLAALELEQKQREAHAKKLKALADDAYRIEQEAKQAEDEALRGTAAPVEEPAPVTLESDVHPLHFLFAGQSRTAPVEPETVVQETVLPIERRKVNPEDYEQLAQMWQSAAGVRITSTQAGILQLYTLSEILAAVGVVVADGRFRFRDEQCLAVTHVLAGGATLDELRQRFNTEKAERTAALNHQQ